MNNKLKEIIKYLQKGYGKKCEQINLDCYSCRAWIVIDFLEEEIAMNEEK